MNLRRYKFSNVSARVSFVSACVSFLYDIAKVGRGRGTRSFKDSGSFGDSELTFENFYKGRIVLSLEGGYK